MKNIFFILILTILFSCSRIQTINTNPHMYSETPNHVIWVQIGGLSDEQIPLLKFNNQQSDIKVWFEQVDCAGKILSYNLYQLRPEGIKSFASQILGSKNIKNECSDFDRPMAWDSFKKNNFRVSILESGISEKDSIEKYTSCKSNFQDDLNDIRIWKMAASPYDKSYFHFQDSVENLKSYMKSGIYFDKSCQNGICYSSLLNNVKTLYGNQLKENGKTFFLIRDNSYLNALKKKDLSEVKEKLNEIDQLLKWFTASVDRNSLIVVTGAESINFDFPKEGREWEDFVKTGKNFSFKNSSLISPVYAQGAGAENFCGIFEESDFARRLNFKVPGKKFNWDAINPFN